MQSMSVEAETMSFPGQNGVLVSRLRGLVAKQRHHIMVAVHRRENA